MVKPVTVRNQYRRERVNLQPYGNTISVETCEDNPFTAAQDVEVTTQAMQGMAGPDPAMRSRPVARHPTQGTVLANTNPVRRPVPGKVSAARFVAPAHRPHGGFVPGLGRLGDDAPVMLGPPSPTPAPADSSTSAWSSIASAIGTGAGAASNVLTSRYNSDAEAARARAAASNATAEASKTERSRVDSMLSSANSHKTLVFSLLGIGALAIVGAVLLKSGKKSKR